MRAPGAGCHGPDAAAVAGEHVDSGPGAGDAPTDRPGITSARLLPSRLNRAYPRPHVPFCAVAPAAFVKRGIVDARATAETVCVAFASRLAGLYRLSRIPVVPPALVSRNRYSCDLRSDRATDSPASGLALCQMMSWRKYQPSA